MSGNDYNKGIKKEPERQALAVHYSLRRVKILFTKLVLPHSCPTKFQTNSESFNVFPYRMEFLKLPPKFFEVSGKNTHKSQNF